MAIEEDKGRKKNAKGLTPKQRRFVQEYIRNGGNATNAAEVAYNTGSRMKDLDDGTFTEKDRKRLRKSAQVQGSQLLRNTKVQKELQRLMARHGLDDNSLVKELSKGVKAPVKEEAMDWHAKLRFIETGFKLAGHFDKEDRDTANTVNFLQMFQVDGDIKEVRPEDFPDPEVSED